MHKTVTVMAHGGCHFTELKPPTGTQHSLKQQPTAVWETVPLVVQHLLPL